MPPRLIRQGEGPAVAYLRELEERAAQRARIERILATIDEPAPEPSRGRRGKRIGFRSAEDDPARLRALPIIGKGVAGAVPGSDPLRALVAKERRRRP